jgi:hypothetical protein
VIGFEFDRDAPHPRCPMCGCFMQVIRGNAISDSPDDYSFELRCNNTRYNHDYDGG